MNEPGTGLVPALESAHLRKSMRYPERTGSSRPRLPAAAARSDSDFRWNTAWIFFSKIPFDWFLFKK